MLQVLTGFLEHGGRVAEAITVISSVCGAALVVHRWWKKRQEAAKHREALLDATFELVRVMGDILRWHMWLEYSADREQVGFMEVQEQAAVRRFGLIQAQERLWTLQGNVERRGLRDTQRLQQDMFAESDLSEEEKKE